MSSVFRTLYTQDPTTVTNDKSQEITGQRKWQTVDTKSTQNDLKENIWFLNDAVVLRQTTRLTNIVTKDNDPKIEKPKEQG